VAIHFPKQVDQKIVVRLAINQGHVPRCRRSEPHCPPAVDAAAGEPALAAFEAGFRANAILRSATTAGVPGPRLCRFTPPSDVRHIVWSAVQGSRAGREKLTGLYTFPALHL